MRSSENEQSEVSLDYFSAAQAAVYMAPIIVPQWTAKDARFAQSSVSLHRAIC